MALFLKENDIEGLVSMREAIEALEGPIREHGLGIATNFARQIARTPIARLSVLQAAIPSLGSMGFKAYTVAPDGVRYWVMLFGEDGEMRALMEGEELSRIRTGASAGIAAKHLSREDSETVGILGTGWNAVSQLEAVCAVRPIKRVVAWSPTRANLLRFCERMSARLGVAVEAAADARAAASEADIVITVTSSKDPVLHGDWLREGTHVNMIGAMKPDYREADDRAIDRAELLVADDLHQCKEEAGEFIKAAREGRLDWDRVSELGAIVAGKSPARTSPASISVFKSLGTGLWDVAMAARIYEAAIGKKAGTFLPIDRPASPLVKGAAFQAR